MCRRRISLLAALVVLLVPLGIAAAAPASQSSTPTESPQIFLVIDISGSMQTHVIPEDAPEDVLQMRDTMREIEQSPDVVELDLKTDEIAKSEAVVAAAETVIDAETEVDEFIRDHGYKSIQLVAATITMPLGMGGCDISYVQGIVTLPSLEEVDALLPTLCYMGVTEDLTTELHEAMAYMDEPGYAELATAYRDAVDAHDQLLTSLNYYNLLSQRESLLVSRGYYTTGQLLEERAEELGYPTRIELAQVAASTLIELSRLDDIANDRHSRIGLVGFSDMPLLVTTFTDDYDMVQERISQLPTVNLTNIGGGLLMALGEFETQGQADQPSLIVLLSDGHVTSGLPREAILERVAPQAVEMGIEVCTVGFASEEVEVDVDLLQGLAEGTEGEYTFARTGEELLNFFVLCRQSLTSSIVNQFTGSMLADDFSEPHTFTVPENTGEVTVTLNYLEGEMEMVLTDPSGQEVGADYPGHTLQQETNLQLSQVVNPTPGEWQVQVRSGEVPQRGSIYNLLISTSERQQPTPTPEPTAVPTPLPTQEPDSIPLWGRLPSLVAGALACLAVLAVVAGAAIFFARRRSRPPSVSPPPAEPPEPPDAGQ